MRSQRARAGADEGRRGNDFPIITVGPDGTVGDALKVPVEKEIRRL
jgi:hypothetical protein